MRRETWIQIAAGGVMTACLAGSVLMTPAIAASSGRARLVFADSAEKGDPPQVALGVAMGAFRGLFVNYLWMRANELKQAGRYFDAVELAKTITRLQPRFPRVWSFHAWNLAYNISVATQTPEERWQWVQAGIKLLRDEGIPANPNDLVIHRELGWIYLHKVAGVMDDAHWYYKRQHAREWTIVLGAPPRMTLEERRASSPAQIYVDRWLKPIAEAPRSLDDLYKAVPEAEELVARLRSEADLGLDKSLLERVELVTSVVTIAQATGIAPPATRNDPLVQLMLDPKYREAGKRLLTYVRRKVLTEQYNMEPERMIRYTLRYGPIDWRHPAAHGLYWSTRGSDLAFERVDSKLSWGDLDFANTDRQTIQSIQELFRTGTIHYDLISPDMWLALPNVDFIDSYLAEIERLRERNPFEARERAFTLYGAGFENFLRDAIRLLYRRGDRPAAEKYQRLLFNWPGLNTHNPELHQELAKPLDDFVVSEILKENRETTPVVALQEIQGALEAAYFNGLLADDDEQFRSQFQYAQQFHALYQETQGFNVFINRHERGRLAFPSFDKFAATVFAMIVESVGVPQGPLMWRRAPEDLKGLSYVLLEKGALRTRVTELSRGGGPGFEVWFPEPKGVELFRQRMNNDTSGMDDDAKIEAR
jgi:hypothetical protein